MKNNTKKLSVALALTALSGVVLGACSNPSTGDTKNNAVSSQTPTDLNANNQPSAQATASVVKVLEGTGQYDNPERTESLTVKLGVDANNVIQSVDYSIPSADRQTQMFAGLFFEGVKSEIIGKKISDVGTYDKLNGSSLTSAGFNQAMQSIQAQIK